MIATILKYFPGLSEQQIFQFETLMRLYPEWNEKINVISRKDIQNLEVNHLLHSLSIAKFISFKKDTKILDLGTGGGLPGIPLAILFPQSKFHLIDRIGKKIRVAHQISQESQLSNITFQHGDIGECHLKCDFVVSRAVMPQPDLIKLIKKNISETSYNALPNGLITLKGGDLSHEIKDYKSRTEIVDLDIFFDEDFFKNKKLVYTAI